MSLRTSRERLLRRIKLLDQSFSENLLNRLTWKRIDRFAYQEGLISMTWQSWSGFCRQLILQSACGSTTLGGTPTTSAYSAHSEEEICFISRQLSQSTAVRTIRAVRGSFEEPSWGDIRKLNLVAAGLALSNAPSISTATSTAPFVEELQRIRNSCAHISSEKLTWMRSRAVAYETTNFEHPSEMIYWGVPTSSRHLWSDLLDEIDIISDLATR